MKYLFLTLLLACACGETNPTDDCLCDGGDASCPEEDAGVDAGGDGCGECPEAPNDYCKNLSELIQFGDPGCLAGECAYPVEWVWCDNGCALVPGAPYAECTDG